MTSFLTIPPFNKWVDNLKLINPHVSKISICFFLLSYLSDDDDWLRLACTSSGWKDLCTLRAHMSFVHQAARPWRSIVPSLTKKKDSPTNKYLASKSSSITKLDVLIKQAIEKK